MTYREFINKLSNQDLAESIVNGTFLDIACVHSNYFESCCQSEPCIEKCIECIKNLLDSDFDEPKLDSLNY